MVLGSGLLRPRLTAGALGVQPPAGGSVHCPPPGSRGSGEGGGRGRRPGGGGASAGPRESQVWGLGSRLLLPGLCPPNSWPIGQRPLSCLRALPGAGVSAASPTRSTSIFHVALGFSSPYAVLHTTFK